MGCASCGQQYVRRQPQLAKPVPNNTPAPVRTPPRIRVPIRYPVTTPDEVKTPVVQEEPKEGVIISHTEYAVDPATGVSVDVIKTGECPENKLPDTEAQPTSFTVESPKTEEGA